MSESYKAVSVGQLTEEIKGLLEGKFAKVYVEGEISGWKVYPSGHAYFTLKDNQAQIPAVMFKWSLDKCAARTSLRDGAKVVVYGNVSVHPPMGKYQLKVLAAKLLGEGDLMQRYLELKAKLEKEGLFEPSRKRELPFLPRHIGIITSEAGAVIHDMCTVLTRRFPALEIRLFPSLVQGDTAPRSIVAGIDYFNNSPGWEADVLIVARGGGSFEDLFCFNDETLVRTVAASRIPVISAVGHETDFTLCDFAADVRAGTPSIAAEIVVPELSKLKKRMEDASGRTMVALRGRGEFFAQKVDHLSDSLAQTLAIAASNAAIKIDRLSTRVTPAMELAYSKVFARYEKASEKLALLSPYGVLDRGYAIVTDTSGAVVKDSRKLDKGNRVDIRLSRGTFAAEVLNPNQ